MEVRFFNFSKRVNSTKTPSGGSSFDCILKDACSVLNPDIELKLGQTDNPTSYNYCYIPDFQRYYFVKWYYSNRCWHAQCTVDVLASWKVEISGADCYIARAASAYNLDVVDRYYPTIARVEEVATESDTAPTFVNDVADGGSYIIGVMGASSGQNGGAITYYHIGEASMAFICNYLLDDTNYDPGQDVSPDLLKAVFNPLQYIVSCMWFPFNVGTTSSTTLQIGWWTLTVNNARELTSALYQHNFSFDVPKHPQSARGDYLNLAPYSEYILNAAMFGCFNIDPVYLIDESSLSCFIYIDLFTGSGRLVIKSKDTLAVVEEHTAQIGVPIQLGQNVLNQGVITGVASNLASFAGSAAMGNVFGMATAGAAAIGSAVEAMAPRSTTLGSNGSMAFNTGFNLIGRFTYIANEDLVSRGRPLCAKRFISQLSGYIMCLDADPEIDCSKEELEQIVGYMNGGFFYE